MARPGHVCPSCWRDSPCPIHGKNTTRTPGTHTSGFTPWNPERIGSYHREHVALRRQLLKAGRGHTCERCHQPGKTEMHHLRPVNQPDAVIFLCPPCHRHTDPQARGKA